MKKRLLMVVFEFPPCNGASVQRILSVYRGFLKAGWDVDVLTAKEHAYENVQPMTEGLLPDNPGGKIVRTIALDVMRHMAFKGKHIGALIKPDRWGLTWIPSATRAGNKLVKERDYDVIWSSSPTPSPHIIASRLVNKSRAKWVTDYRDPMPYLHGRCSDINAERMRVFDREVYKKSDLMVFATEGIKNMYVDLHKHPTPDDFKVMENGFDEDMMAEQKKAILSKIPSSFFSQEKLSVYYAGVLYEDGRDPAPIFEALSKFAKEQSRDIEMVFQGAGEGGGYREMIERLSIADIVRFEQGVPFSVAVENMLSADLLLIIQDEKFNNQVPGKIYEYLASGKSLLLKTPKESQTCKVGLHHNGVWQADNKDSIFRVLCDIFEKHKCSTKNLKSQEDTDFNERDVLKHSRQSHVKSLLSWVSNIN